MLTDYLIVVCGNCGGYLLAKGGQRTRTCPYCGARVILAKTKKVAVVNDAEAASRLLRKYKAKERSKHGTLEFEEIFKKGHKSNA